MCDSSCLASLSTVKSGKPTIQYPAQLTECQDWDWKLQGQKQFSETLTHAKFEGLNMDLFNCQTLKYMASPWLIWLKEVKGVHATGMKSNPDYKLTLYD